MKYTKQQAAKAEQEFKQNVQRLTKLGFKHVEPTKSKIFSLVKVTKQVKSYISIRHDYERDLSAAIGEYWCQTSTQTKQIGGEVLLLRFTPKHSTMKLHKGYNKTACYLDFNQIAVAIFRVDSHTKEFIKL